MTTFAKYMFYGTLGLVTLTLIVMLVKLPIPGTYKSEKVKRVANTIGSVNTVKSITDRYALPVDKRLKPWFDKAGVKYPPAKISMLAFKKEKRFELWALKDFRWVFIRQYPFTASSGILGPKLREGDKQIPEGVYEISAMNPNSSYHLSLKINYPNNFDLQHALKEGRTEPGSNIFIHGRSASIGCIALGDVAIEELFVLVAYMGQINTTVIVAPWDFRRREFNISTISKRVRKAWLEVLYETINSRLKRYPLSASAKKTQYHL